MRLVSTQKNNNNNKPVEDEFRIGHNGDGDGTPLQQRRENSPFVTVQVKVSRHSAAHSSNAWLKPATSSLYNQSSKNVKFTLLRLDAEANIVIVYRCSVRISGIGRLSTWREGTRKKEKTKTIQFHWRWPTSRKKN